MIVTVIQSGIIMVKTLLQKRFGVTENKKITIASFSHLCYSYICNYNTRLL